MPKHGGGSKPLGIGTDWTLAPFSVLLSTRDTTMLCGRLLPLPVYMFKNAGELTEEKTKIQLQTEKLQNDLCFAALTWALPV